jgi:hypothetical protein
MFARFISSSLPHREVLTRLAPKPFELDPTDCVFEGAAAFKNDVRGIEPRTRRDAASAPTQPFPQITRACAESARQIKFHLALLFNGLAAESLPRALLTDPESRGFKRLAKTLGVACP